MYLYDFEAARAQLPRKFHPARRKFFHACKYRREDAQPALDELPIGQPEAALLWKT